MDVREIPIIVVFAVNLLVGIAGVTGRDRARSVPLGMLAFSVAAWSVSVLWDRWVGPGTGPKILMSAGLLTGPLWISWSSARGNRKLILLQLILLAVYLPFRIASHSLWRYAGIAVLVFGYGSVAIALGMIAKRGDEESSLDAREMLNALALVFGLSGLVTVTAVFVPSLMRPYDQAAPMVAAQVALIVGLRRSRLPREFLLRRSMVWLAYALVAGGALFLPLAVLSYLLDVTPPLWALAGLVAVALISAAVFPWLGPRLSGFVERALFPEAAAMRREVENLHRDLEDVRARLRRAERMRLVGEIAAQLAHEIKNPLGPIKGYAKLLLEDARSGKSEHAAMEKGLGIIAYEAGRIDERISKLLGFAREHDAPRRCVDLNQTCRRAAMLIEGSGEMAGGVKIELNLDPAGVSAFADEAAIGEAVYNLLLNAAQAAGENGIVTITTTAPRADSGDEILIEVSDDGPGFPEGDAEKIFEPFYTTRPGGTGLGLGIVRNIVKSHGGSIKARRAEAGGAAFIIRLPASKS